MITTALALAVSLSVPSYNFTGFSWPSGQFPIPYCISTNGTQTALTQAQQRTLITEGVNYWRSAGGGGGLTCSNYDAAPAAYVCARVIDLGDGKNNIYFERNNWQWGSQTLGVTHSGGSGSCGSVRDSTGANVRLTCQGYPDIELNDINGITWDDGGRRGNTDLASIVSHEYGHFIGLDHCNENNTCNQGQAVMYAAYLGGDFAVPRSDDAGGACALYPGTPGGVGYPCTNNNACTSSLCVSPASGGYCTATCGACPTGYACDTLAGFAGTICVRDDGLNRDVCEECQGGIANACANNGLCVGGIPDPQGGRCTIPCPNPAASNGGCGMQFSCTAVRGAGNYCLPRSGDCTNLGNFTELQFGQACSAQTADCASGLECIDICTRTCTGAGQGNCPGGFVCNEFNFQTGPESYCAPPVTEGQDCSGFVACQVGPCLRAGTTQTLCYKDCANNANACNNAQTCETYNLSGGGTVSICEPPGVPPLPPRPDAAVPPDSGGGPPNADAGPIPNNPDAAAPVPGEDASMTMMTNADAATTPTPMACSCDLYVHCESGCDCDPDCPCLCDQTTVCDPNCTCDPECYGNGGGGELPGRSNCASSGTPDGLGLWVLVGLIAISWGRRVERRRALR